jgi:hydrogenase-4 component B
MSGRMVDALMPLDLSLLAIGLAAASGLPGLCLGRASAWGERLAAGLMGLGTVLGLTAAGAGLAGGEGVTAGFPWPAAGDALIGFDALSAFFLVPVFLLGGLGAVYGLGYWPQRRHPGSGRSLRCFWGLLVAGMALLVLSRHAMSFLLGWEVMALSAFFLVSAEDHRRECRRAGWLYLIATHLGTLALFALWRQTTGSYALQPAAPGAVGAGAATALFFLALAGFGLKAGVMPLHFWLPGAHANAPSHVSAMLSGVLLKMGIYGLVRFLSLLPDPPGAWGGLILFLGGVSGLLGVVFAIGQHDLKRLLAYHSVENIGIILMGLGLAMLGRSAGRPEWVVLGLAGCLLHVWNHFLFKSLLFLCAGGVVHGAHTREIDRLGGLARAMPWTAAMFLVGTLAICGLPPLNGFVSELFVYLGLLRTVAPEGNSTAVLAAPVLAAIGALALACFVKAYGAVFLGHPRTRGAAHAREAPAAMKGPMGVLAALCALIGLAPVLVGPLLDAAISCWMPAPLPAALRVGALAPLRTVSAAAAALLVLAFALWLFLGRRQPLAARGLTWDCGYALPSGRMQYSASSFAQMVVGLFRWVLRPRVHRPAIHGFFPAPARMCSHVDDAVLDRLLVPTGRSTRQWLHRLRWFQHGLTQHYVLYILIAVLLLLGAMIPFGDVAARLFSP